MKNGIYRQALSEEEAADFDHAEMGHLDEELKLARVRIARALKAEKADPTKDYSSVIDRFMGRVESLEQTRRKLMEESGEERSKLEDANADIP